MKTTQAEKLKRILELGTFNLLSYEFLFNELREQYSTDGFESLYSLDEEKKRLQEFKSKGLSCYEFTPFKSNDGDYDIIRQFAVNPFILIDKIYNW